jgi:hypothetical protein
LTVFTSERTKNEQCCRDVKRYTGRKYYNCPDECQVNVKGL